MSMAVCLRQVGMLSLGYPKINFQVANTTAHEQLLEAIRDKLPDSTPDNQEAPATSQTQSAFQV